jgi:putative transposase
VTKYRWIAARKAEGFAVRLCCSVTAVAPSSYYDWHHAHGAGPTSHEIDEAYLVNEIKAIHDTLDDSYGSPRLTHELARRRSINHKRVERVVREHALYAVDARRRRCRTTIPDVSAPPLADLVQRDFRVGEPGQRTCGDITYIRTSEGWLFLAGVLDLGSRRCLGYAMDERMPTALVSRALNMAIDLRGGAVDGMIFHADRGTQYMSREFRELCEQHGVAQSVGRTGSCHDNAVSESFWATMKREMVSRWRFETRADARRAIIAWINHYNGLRQHSSINNMSPIEWELQFARRQFQAA